MDIEIIWKNIVSNENEKFYTKTGIEFVYTINGDRIQPIPTNGSRIYNITRSTIEQVIKNYLPLKRTSQLQNFFAPSYIYAILTDKRIM